MKILSTEGLTKLIQLIKSNFIGINNTVTTNTVTLATVATSGSYNDLSNKPTIPTVGDGTLTITQDGTTLGTVTMNQSTNSTIDIPPAATRNIGEIVTSTIPLTDAGLHLLDGALISGSGIYADFVDYIADLYSEEETTWQQPVLTSNGTVGGVNYACEASSYEGDFYAYKAFDNDTSTRWGSSSSAVPDWLTFYSPYPLKVSEVYLDFYQTTERYISGEIQGSNDNSNWTTLTTFSNNSSQTLTLSISTNNKYKYIRFYGTSTVGSPWGKVAKFNITATYTQTPNFFTTEANWQSAVTTYGVCGKFVYDSTNNTVRLPKYSNKIYTQKLDSTASVVGNGKALGFTTGSGNYCVLRRFTASDGNYINYPYAQMTSTSALNIGDNVDSSYPADRSGLAYGITTDATKSGIIADLSNITTSLDGYYYIVVATITKTDIQVDIDEIATDLNGKADVDLSNISASASAKSMITTWGMPDYSAGVSKTNNIDYSETTNGYLIVDYTSDTYSELNITINGTSFRFYQGYSGTDYNHCNVGVVPIPKNVQYRITTLNGCRVRYFPCIGG